MASGEEYVAGHSYVLHPFLTMIAPLFPTLYSAAPIFPARC